MNVAFIFKIGPLLHWLFWEFCLLLHLFWEFFDAFSVVAINRNQIFLKLVDTDLPHIFLMVLLIGFFYFLTQKKTITKKTEM